MNVYNTIAIQRTWFPCRSKPDTQRITAEMEALGREVLGMVYHPPKTPGGRGTMEVAWREETHEEKSP